MKYNLDNVLDHLDAFKNYETGSLLEMCATVSDAQKGEHYVLKYIHIFMQL